MEQQQRENQLTEPADIKRNEPAETVHNPGRRRFGRAGLGTSGVLLTLACKPVLGGVVCKTPSGSLSANQSTHGGQTAICSGRRPQYWQNNMTWPIEPKTKFSRVFSTHDQSAFADATLAELIVLHKSDTHQLGMYLTSALLNARMGWTPFLSEDRIQAMYLEWRTRGEFSPTANVKWTAQEIVKYLKSTQS